MTHTTPKRKIPFWKDGFLILSFSFSSDSDDLHAHWRQVVAARKVIDIRAQSSTVSFCLCAIISFGYDLVDAARAVHDLFHLRLCLPIIGRWIKLAPKSVRGAIQIVHRFSR